MGKTVKDVMKLIKDNDIKMVDFKMVDINGQYRHVTIPAQNFNESTMSDGIGFDASNIQSHFLSQQIIFSVKSYRRTLQNKHTSDTNTINPSHIKRVPERCPKDVECRYNRPSMTPKSV